MTVQLANEQIKYKRMPLSPLDWLQPIVPLDEDKKVAEGVVCDETETLEKDLQRMFEVMQKVAEFSRDYVKGSRRSCSGFGKD